MFLLQCPIDWGAKAWKEAFLLVAPNGMSQLQFQMLLRKKGMPASAFRNQDLVELLFSMFPKQMDRTVSWGDFVEVMDVLAAQRAYELLSLTFNTFDTGRTGKISEERMIEVLLLVCKGIARINGTKLPFPFDDDTGIKQWITTAYSALGEMGQSMNQKEFSVIGTSSSWALSILSLGCFHATESEMNLDTSWKLKKQTLKLPTERSPRTKRKSAPNTPKRKSSETTPLPKSVVQEFRKLKKELDASTQRELDLQARIKQLERNEKRISFDTATDGDLLGDPLSEEWTDSAGEETMEEKNARLIVQVRSLQKGLKDFVEKNRMLELERSELSEKNETLKQMVRKLHKNRDLLEEEEVNLLHNRDDDKKLMAQVDTYHSLLSWLLQTQRIGHPEGASGIPDPPGQVQKIESIMKKGDFIQNWKKRLAVSTASAIFYFSEPPKAQGRIEYKTVRGVRDSEDTSSMPNTLEILTPERVWSISFPTKAKAQAWHNMLQRIAEQNQEKIKKAKEKKRQAEVLRKRKQQEELEAKKRRSTPRTPTKVDDVWM